MKAALVGVGQAGGKLAQALAEYDSSKGFGAVRGTLAVNTAAPDLQPLSIPTVLVGQERVDGHGVGADNELAARIMQTDVNEVMGSLDGVVDPATEAIFVIAGLGGGTGSGGAPVVARELRRVYDIPVYGLGVIPGRDEGAIYQKNAGRSLKTLVREVDSLLLVDNDAWHDAGESVGDAYRVINQRVAERVGLLLAAGEVVDGVGESVVDTSEVINTLRNGGLATLGYAAADASEDPAENINVITSTTRKSLLTGQSVPETTTAEAALVVIAGDPERISRKGAERARKWVEGETGSLQVRGGDFPIESEKIAVITLLAGIADSPRLDHVMARAKAANVAEERADPNDAFANDDLDGLF
jgi:cell division GTPase FtsZ